MLDYISNMTDELFDVVRVAGKDLDAFIDKHTSKGQRDGAKVIFANFKKDPFDTDGSLEPSPQRAA